MNLYEFGRWKQQIVEKLAADPNIREILLPAPQPDAGGERRPPQTRRLTCRNISSITNTSPARRTSPRP